MYDVKMGVHDNGDRYVTLTMGPSEVADVFYALAMSAEEDTKTSFDLVRSGAQMPEGFDPADAQAESHRNVGAWMMLDMLMSQSFWEERQENPDA